MFWLRFVWPQTGFLAVEGAWQGAIWGTDSFHFPRVAKGKIALAMWGTGPLNMAQVYFEFPHGVATAMGISNFRYDSHFITKVFRSFPAAFSESFSFHVQNRKKLNYTTKGNKTRFILFAQIQLNKKGEKRNKTLEVSFVG